MAGISRMLELLPEELFREILSWLPVKTLLRFRCVNKSWLALISDPNFTLEYSIKQEKRHKQLSNSKSSLLAFVIRSQSYKKGCISHLDLSVRRDVDDPCGKGIVNSVINSVMVDCVHIPYLDNFVSRDSDDSVRILGPRNGIICMCNGRDKMALWNPSLREFMVIPASTIASQPNTVHTAYDYFGFGYDRSIVNGYKLVRFAYNLCKSNGANKLSSHIEMYTLSTNSWKLIPHVESFASEILQCSSDSESVPSTDVYLKGVCHWLAHWLHPVSRRPGRVVLNFDMSTEAIGTMCIPSVGSFELDASLILYDEECLGVVVQLHNARGNGFEMWVMKEYGKEDSWSKQFKVGLVPGLNTIVGFRKNIGRLIMDDIHGKLVLYNVDTHEVQYLYVHGKPEHDYILVADFVESLVSINGAVKEDAQLVSRGSFAQQMFEISFH